jgi:Ca2+-transporting ATPase
MLHRLLDTESLSGAQWAVVLGCSLLAPALVWADKALQLHRRKQPAPAETGAPPLVLAGH